MNRREFLQASVLSVAAAVATENQVLGNISTSAPDRQAHFHDEQVDFGYAFAPPHRMTVGRPEASEKLYWTLMPVGSRCRGLMRICEARLLPAAIDSIYGRRYKKMRRVTVNGVSHGCESQNELVRLAPTNKTLRGGILLRVDQGGRSHRRSPVIGTLIVVPLRCCHTGTWILHKTTLFAEEKAPARTRTSQKPATRPAYAMGTPRREKK
jgi:hypothetical protein